MIPYSSKITTLQIKKATLRTVKITDRLSLVQGVSINFIAIPTSFGTQIKLLLLRV